MMSNGPPPARPDGTVDDARWLFPQERAPPPRDEGCKQHGFGDPALLPSNGSPPTPSPPSSRPHPHARQLLSPPSSRWGGSRPLMLARHRLFSPSGAVMLAMTASTAATWSIFAVANSCGSHRLRIGTSSGILNVLPIPRVLGTVSLDPADGFTWIIEPIGSISQLSTLGTWLRTRLVRLVPARHFPTRSNSSSPSSPCVG